MPPADRDAEPVGQKPEPEGDQSLKERGADDGHRAFRRRDRGSPGHRPDADRRLVLRTIAATASATSSRRMPPPASPYGARARGPSATSTSCSTASFRATTATGTGTARRATAPTTCCPPSSARRWSSRWPTGRPLLGQWQSVVLVDLNADNPRRHVRCSWIGRTRVGVTPARHAVARRRNDTTPPGRRTTDGRPTLTIDCDECSLQHTDACDDCVVTFLLEREPDDAVVIDADEARAIRMLERAGLVPRPPLRRQAGLAGEPLDGRAPVSGRGEPASLLVTNDFPPKVGGIQSYLWELWQPARPRRRFAVLTASLAPRRRRVRRRAGRPRAPHRAGARPILFFPTPVVPDASAGWPTTSAPDSSCSIRRARSASSAAPRRALWRRPARGRAAVPGRLPGCPPGPGAVSCGGAAVVGVGRRVPGRRGGRAGRRPDCPPVVEVPPGVDVDRFGPLAATRTAGSGPPPAGPARRRPAGGQRQPARASQGHGRPDRGGRRGSSRRSRTWSSPSPVRAATPAGSPGRCRTTGAPVRLLGRSPRTTSPRCSARPTSSRWPAGTGGAGLEQEGFGIVFLEAAAAGVPQVAGRQRRRRRGGRRRRDRLRRRPTRATPARWRPRCGGSSPTTICRRRMGGAARTPGGGILRLRPARS